jgi:hypothetical protein
MKNFMNHTFFFLLGLVGVLASSNRSFADLNVTCYEPKESTKGVYVDEPLFSMERIEIGVWKITSRQTPGKSAVIKGHALDDRHVAVENDDKSISLVFDGSQDPVEADLLASEGKVKLMSGIFTQTLVIGQTQPVLCKMGYKTIKQDLEKSK